MKWFGQAHGAPYERDTEHVPTPVGAVCSRCNEAITATDDGLLVPHLDALVTPWVPSAHDAAFHYACHLRSIVGGLNHQRGCCTCCGGTEPPDPAGLTRREAAEAAVAEWEGQRWERQR